MAALLFPTIIDFETLELVTIPKDSVRRSKEERRLLGADWVERKTIWEDCREFDGADFTLIVYLSYDELGRVKKLDPNLHLPLLVGKVLLEASWSACNESDEVNGFVDIGEILCWDREGVIPDICNSYAAYISARETDLSARKALYDSISSHIKKSAWDFVRLEASRQWV
jgi:hypothetical protein